MPKLLAVLFASHLCFAATAGEQTPLAAVQALFDAMSAHDAAKAGSLFLPDAQLFSVTPEGTAQGLPHQKWVDHLGASKDTWLERISDPKVLEHGSVAVVWGDYDFHLNGKLHHCGVDSFSLLKTNDGWKINAVSDTHETSCTDHSK